jgi:hypothetical protein
MGLSNREGGKYITIIGGKFTVRVPEGTPGAVARVNKLGKTVHELKYDSFTGKLVNVRTRDSEYGKSWEFDFRDAGEVYTLQLPYSNSFSKGILKILPNADLTQEMKVQPSQKVEDGKTKSSIFISQGGTTLKHKYTKDNPNGMPQMEQVQVKGNLVWDDSKQLAFLHEMVERDILPRLPKDVATAPAATEGGSSIDDVLGAGEKGDDDDF